MDVTFEAKAKIGQLGIQDRVLVQRIDFASRPKLNPLGLLGQGKAKIAGVSKV